MTGRDIKPLDAIRTIQGHDGGTTSLSFSQDGLILASGGYDCAIRLWDVSTGKAIQALAGHRRGHVAYSPNREILVSAGLHQDALIYDVRTWQSFRILEGTGTCWGVAFTPDGEALAVIQPEMPVQLWNARTWQIERGVELGSDHVYALTFAPQEHILAFAQAEDGKVHIRQVESDKAVFSPHNPVTYGLAFSPNGEWLASAGADSRVCVWKTSSLELKSQVELPDPALCVAYSTDGRLLGTGDLSGLITVFDATT